MTSAETKARFAAVFKAYDVRGRVPDELDVAMLWAIGRSFGSYAARAGAGRVVVGRDMRPSGLELSRALAAGVLAAGLGVVDAGLVSTDMLYFASGHLGLPGAVLTASHNPAVYNGIKLCLSGARPIGAESGLGEIRDGAAELYQRAVELYKDAPQSGPGAVASTDRASLEESGRYEQVDLLDAFSEHVRSFLTCKLRPMSIVADTANGMGGLVVPAVFAALPVELDILYGELDGSFPNHPADPIQPENLAALRERVLELGADAGLAFDGDADRVFLVDDKAEPLSGSLTTALVASAVLAVEPGAKILYNLICSKVVPEVIAENGGRAVRTRVGHSFIKAVMAETGALFGGEHSGHYYFRENFRADSGIIAALIVLGVVSSSGAPLSELRKPLERYADSGEINTEVADSTAVLRGVAAAYEPRGASLDWTDGLTADLGKWWFNLRPSNTEPLLRLNVEAGDNVSLAAHLGEVQGLVRDLDAGAKGPEKGGDS